MKKIMVFLIALSALSCKQSKSQISVNPEAKKLDHLAVEFAYSISSPQLNDSLEYSIDLLNKAIKIDSNYFLAYSHKFTFQNNLKQYVAAVLTGKKIIKLKPNDPYFIMLVGQDCEKSGDTIASRKYFNDALIKCNSLLDTLSVNGKMYILVEADKAIDFIMLYQPEKGYSLLKKLYNKETNPEYKQLLLEETNKTRNELLHEKD